jgi:signal transduction histidine kinase
MKSVVRKLWPDSLLHQILVLMGFASVFMILVGLVSLFLLKMAFEASPTIMNGHYVSVAVAKLNDTPADQRVAMLLELQSQVPELEIEFIGDNALPAGANANDDKRKRFGPFVIGETMLGMRIEHVVGPAERGLRASPLLFIRLRDGSLLSAEWSMHGPPPLAVLGMPFYLFFGFLVLSFSGLMIWATRGLVRPLSDLARSAETFGENSIEPVPIRENGPKEVRIAAHAFNRMQLRINETVENRTRMLAAISHDLRTPLTRLQLRLDLLESGDIRDRSLQDLSIMEQQINTALTFLRDGSSSEPIQRIDLPSLLRSLSDQYADLGLDLKVRCVGNLAVNARSAELARALSNLIDNAIQYASGAEIAAERQFEMVRIDVVDHGPGIAPEDRDRLLEPFERGDTARQIRHGTGFGLGLATSKAVAESASGKLQLLETVGGGLTVRLSFPASEI